MIRFALLTVGCLLFIIQQYIAHISAQLQLVIFFAGIVVLGIPHGAADLLVATRNASNHNKAFSRIRFFAIYLGRLVGFAAILLLLPQIGIGLFILFAAYHFGETDLHRFNTNSLIGKLFVVAYGMLILCIILLHHFEEVLPICQLFGLNDNAAGFINWLGLHRYLLMTISAACFFASAFGYFLHHPPAAGDGTGRYLVHLAAIACVLFKLPLMLGFTFYFVIWHSVLSLKNIVVYLRVNETYALKTIIKDILLYSSIALLGIGLLAMVSRGFSGSNMVGYIFLGLGILTAPHMQIMHSMYNSLRSADTQTQRVV